MLRILIAVYYLIGLFALGCMDREDLNQFFWLFLVTLLWPWCVAIRGIRRFRKWWDDIALKHPM